MRILITGGTGLVGGNLIRHAAPQGGQLLLHQRQRQNLTEAIAAAGRAAALLAPAGQIADVAELAAIELRQALRHLGLITGEVFTEDILASIFSRFCVGK